MQSINKHKIDNDSLTKNYNVNMSSFFYNEENAKKKVDVRSQLGKQKFSTLYSFLVNNNDNKICNTKEKIDYRKRKKKYPYLSFFSSLFFSNQQSVSNVDGNDDNDTADDLIPISRRPLPFSSSSTRSSSVNITTKKEPYKRSMSIPQTQSKPFLLTSLRTAPKKNFFSFLPESWIPSPTSYFYYSTLLSEPKRRFPLTSLFSLHSQQKSDQSDIHQSYRPFCHSVGRHKKQPLSLIEAIASFTPNCANDNNINNTVVNHGVKQNSDYSTEVYENSEIDIIDTSYYSGKDDGSSIEFGNNNKRQLLPITRAPLFQVIRRRFIVLACLLVLQSFSQIILEMYEKILTSYSILPLFLTMLVGAGGNAGNQSAVRAISGLVTGEFQPRQYLRVLRKEMAVGLINASILFVICFIRIFYFFGIEMIYSIITVCVSLFCIVLSSAFIGTSLPFFLNYIGLDKVHAAPVIQVIMDIMGVFITCFIFAHAIPDNENNVKFNNLTGFNVKNVNAENGNNDKKVVFNIIDKK